MRASINWLSVNFRKHAATVKKRTESVPKDKNGKMDLAAAAEAIYCGANGHNGNGEFISTPEAVRQYTIAKKQEIDLDMEIKRGDRIPRQDCELALNEVLASINGSLKARRNQPLDDATINEIFAQLREAGQKMQ